MIQFICSCNSHELYGTKDIERKEGCLCRKTQKNSFLRLSSSFSAQNRLTKSQSRISLMPAVLTVTLSIIITAISTTFLRKSSRRSSTKSSKVTTKQALISTDFSRLQTLHMNTKSSSTTSARHEAMNTLKTICISPASTS